MSEAVKEYKHNLSLEQSIGYFILILILSLIILMSGFCLIYPLFNEISIENYSFYDSKFQGFVITILIVSLFLLIAVIICLYMDMDCKKEKLYSPKPNIIRKEMRDDLSEESSEVVLDYNIKVFETLQDLLNDLDIPFKSNIRFMDLIDFAKLFNFNARDIQMLEHINQIIRKAFLGDDDSLNTLEDLSNSALYNLRKAYKRKS